MPDGVKLVGFKFIFKTKLDEWGEPCRFKARLVAQGFSQIEGVNYSSTFAPVADMTSIRVLLSHAAREGWHIHQADVDRAYLHGVLEEDVYLRVPKGVDDPSLEGKCLKLKRTLYGLKQAGAVWNETVHAEFIKLGYTRAQEDACIYIRQGGDAPAYLALYVDDILLTSSSLLEIDRVKSALASRFGIKDIGPANFILGIQLRRQPGGSILLSQEAYTRRIISTYGFDSVRPVNTPMKQGLQLPVVATTATPDRAAITRYRQVIGALLYLANGTRPDIAYAVGHLARFPARHGSAHWDALERVFAYLKGTAGRALALGTTRSPLHGLYAYSDLDWNGDVNTSCSTAGAAVFYADGLVFWRSKRHDIPAGSTCAAEYMSVYFTGQELEWIRELLGSLGLQPQGAIRLLGDNKGAVFMANNEAATSRARYIRTRFHSLRESVHDGELDVAFIPTDAMVADVLTKAHGGPEHARMTTSLGVQLHRGTEHVVSTPCSRGGCWVCRHT